MDMENPSVSTAKSNAIAVIRKITAIFTNRYNYSLERMDDDSKSSEDCGYGINPIFVGLQIQNPIDVNESTVQPTIVLCFVRKHSMKILTLTYVHMQFSR